MSNHALPVVAKILRTAPHLPQDRPVHTRHDQSRRARLQLQERLGWKRGIKAWLTQSSVTDSTLSRAGSLPSV